MNLVPLPVVVLLVACATACANGATSGPTPSAGDEHAPVPATSAEGPASTEPAADPSAAAPGASAEPGASAAPAGSAADGAGALVCCESFGYGSMMKKCCESYAWTTPSECAVGPGHVGGGKSVVDDARCPPP